MKRVRPATRCSTDDDQPPPLQHAQAVAESAFIPSQCLHQFAMPHGEPSTSAVMLRHQQLENPLLPSDSHGAAIASFLTLRYNRRSPSSPIIQKSRPLSSDPKGSAIRVLPGVVAWEPADPHAEEIFFLLRKAHFLSFSPIDQFLLALR